MIPAGKYQIQLIGIEDLDGFWRLLSDNRPRLEAFFAGTVARTRTFEDTANYLSEIVRKAEDKIYLPYLIFDGDRPVGFIDVKNTDWNIPKGELGCFIDAAFEGTGVATYAFTVLTDHLFNEMGFNKLFLRTHESNASAKALAEKCGFVIEGILRRDYKSSNGDLKDLLYYGKIK